MACGPILATPQRIMQWLAENGIEFRHIAHAPTRTSEESAAARVEPIEIGAKALLVRADSNFTLLVMSAAKRLDSTKAKQVLSCKSIRFATPDELLELTALVPGSVPPFGRPILPFDLVIDVGITDLDRVAFNAASLTESLVIRANHYLRAANPKAITTIAQ